MSAPLWEPRPSTGRVSRTALRWFTTLIGPWRPLLPLLILLGLASSLAESVGVSLVIVFLDLLLGGDAAVSGTLGRMLHLARLFAGDRPSALAALIFALIVAKSLLSLGYTLLGTTLRNAISEDVRNRIQARYLDAAYGHVRRHEPGWLTSVLQADSWAVADAFYSLTRIAISLCAVLVFGIVLLLISWQIALAAAAGSALLFLALRGFDAPARRMGDEVVAINAALAERMLATLSGLRAIRAFAGEEAEKARFRAVSAEARRRFVAIERLYGILNPLSELGALVLLAAVAAGAVLLGVPVLRALAALALLWRLQPHLRELEGSRLSLTTHEASLRNVRAVLDAGRGDPPPDGTQPVAGIEEGIRFEGVDFAYPDGAPVLTGASFTIPARGITALAGPSGVGKSTVAALLLRLYAPDRGAILVDGVALDRIARGAWLRQVAMAGQDTELVAGTMAENIAFGRPDADPSAIRAAAIAAGIAEHIESLPDGYATLLDERGLNLSGGQRQRIGIARALLREPALLILDEATGALEPALEDAILARLRRLYADRAILLISHRPALVAAADHVVRLGPPPAAEAAA